MKTKVLIVILTFSVLFAGCAWMYSIDRSGCLLDVLMAQSGDEREEFEDITVVYQRREIKGVDALIKTEETVQDLLCDSEVLISLYPYFTERERALSLEDAMARNPRKEYLAIGSYTSKIFEKRFDDHGQEFVVYETLEQSALAMCLKDIVYGSSVQTICGKRAKILDVFVSYGRGVVPSSVYYLTNQGTYVRYYDKCKSRSSPAEFDIPLEEFQRWNEQAQKYITVTGASNLNLKNFIQQRDPSALYKPHITYYAVVRLAILAPPVLVFIGMDIASIVRRRKKRIEETYW